MAGTHTLWSPSGAKAWRSCLGYVVMNDGKKDESSVYAAEGTAYHAESEYSIMSGFPVADRVGQQVEADGFKFTITDDLADCAQVYVDRIRERMAAGASVEVEVRTDTSKLLGIPDQSGTTDARVIDFANSTLEIHDLKFGAGIKVYATERGEAPLWQRVNDQLGIYGAAEWQFWSSVFTFTALKLHIHQPRLDHYDTVTLTAEEVRSFSHALRTDALASWQIWNQWNKTDGDLDLEAYLTPSHEACRWCLRAGSCRVRSKSILETFATMSAKNLPLMTAEELAKCLDKTDEMQAWCRAVYAEALSRVEQKAPDAPPGWKTVEGRKGDRTADPQVLRDRIRIALQACADYSPEAGDPVSPEHIPQLFTEPELKSVAQIEKAVKKLGVLGKAIWRSIVGDPEKGIPSAITQSSGRPSLVRDFDARPELAPQPVTFELRPPGEEFSGKTNAAEGLI